LAFGNGAAVIVIPARMASRRLPGKPLADIHGAPMIVHVLRRAEAAGLGPVYVACAEPEVARAVTAAGGRAVMTDPALPSGSDRVFAAVRTLDPEGRFATVVNLQGDLPAIASAALAAVLTPLAVPEVAIATLACETHDARELADPNVVKAVLSLAPDGRTGRALYFSRAAVPAGVGPRYHHIGVYAYRRVALERFVALPPSRLERQENLEQLRALEAGLRIDAALVDNVPLGVDTPNDLERIRAALAPADGP